MRPVPIPDERVWPGAVRRVIAGPDGDLTSDEIRPVEALIDRTELGLRFCMLIQLDDGDLEKLRAPHFWITFLSDHLHPFDVTLPPEVS